MMEWLKRKGELICLLNQSLKGMLLSLLISLSKDPFCYMWAIATHVEDVSSAELERRLSEYSKNL